MKCQKQVSGYSGAIFKKFNSRTTAERFVQEKGSSNSKTRKKKRKKRCFYAVARGRRTGVYNSFEECKQMVEGFVGSKYRKFESMEEARKFVSGTSYSSSSFNIPTDTPNSSEGETRRFRTDHFVGSKQENEINSKLPPIVGGKRNRDDVSNGELYRLLPPEKKSKVGHQVTVYTDGSCTNNQNRSKARAGVGVFFGEGDPRNVSRRLEGLQTNNRAELMAFADAIQAVEDGDTDIEIRTDSHYSMMVVKGRWKAKKNTELVKHVQNLIKSRSGKVIFVKVPAHTGKKDGNYFADLFANQGALKEL